MTTYYPENQTHDIELAVGVLPTLAWFEGDPDEPIFLDENDAEAIAGRLADLEDRELVILQAILSLASARVATEFRKRAHLRVY